VQTFVGTSLAFQLPAELVQGVRKVSQREQATLFMTLLAAFQVLLARYSGQRDIVVGSPIAGRTRTELEGMIGFLVNTLALRVQLTENPTFGEVVQQVREVALQAFAHQDVPFEQVVQALQPERVLSHSPLFQVLFVFQNNEQTALSLPTITSTPLPIASRIAKFDLTMALQEEGETIQGELEYNTDLFDEATMQRLLGHYLQLLTEVLRDASQPVLGIPLLTAGELRQRCSWNATEVDFPRDLCLQNLFEEQAVRTPQAIAVRFEDQDLRYAELNARANQVAHYLRARGVGPDTLVGLCVERSLEMIIGLLGILKASGAYLPLDPDYPAERLAYMLNHTQTPLLLTQQHLLERLPNHRAEVLCLDTDWPQIAALPTSNLTSNAVPDQLAYVIYTSGSTGTPKGVMISQRALVNLLTAFAQIFPLTPDDTFVAVTTLAFDIAGLELFLPLISGACLAIASRETTRDSQRLALLLTQTQATIMQATPATWKLLVADGWPGNKQLAALCGGEALPISLANELKSRVKSLWNVYGPTETTIWSSSYQITPETERVTIGYPLANTQMYLLDKELQLVPIGVAGELYIGGAGLARGYFQQAERTAEQFLPDPFSRIPGARLYRTGDIARHLADGTLEYLERGDHQVKLRGFRIELGEIEVVLRDHPAVQECVVVAREATPAEKRLVAYLVLKPEHVVTSSDLRSHLGMQLPAYMLPSLFVTLPALPLTKNGKIDRRALPKPESNPTEIAAAPVMPDTLLEKQLASIWTEVLGVTGVSTHDNFFDIGGHSLLSIRVAQLIREHLAIEVPIVDLFRYPTIAALTSHLSQQQAPASSAPYDAIREQARLQKEALRRQQEHARQRRERRGPIRNNSTR
jgi:amino acid adenylation domain-containing protein